MVTTLNNPQPPNFWIITLPFNSIGYTSVKKNYPEAAKQHYKRIC